MKLLRQKLAVLAITLVALVNSTFSAPVSVSVPTYRMYVYYGNSMSKDISVYDSLGLLVASVNTTAYGNLDNGSPYAEISVSTNLLPGRYSFSILGDDSSLY